MAEIYPIAEFESFVKDKVITGYRTLPEKTFDDLLNFLLEGRGKKDPVEFMNISARRGLGTLITAQNYIGVIALRNGDTIEILPKIYKKNSGEYDGKQVKKIVLNILRTLPESPFRSVQESGMDVARMPVLEIFIRSFLNEVFMIVKHGLKHNYTQTEANEPFFKGQMLFPEQIRRNFAHQEKNCIRYDVFSTNCPENRILKTTLLFLYRQSFSEKNKRDIKILLSAFEDVPESDAYRSDISKCGTGRDSKDYRIALKWSEIFLEGKSFTSYSGSTAALALLYPMETLFETYVAHMMKIYLDSNVYTVSVQEKKYSLFDFPDKRFAIKPDIVVRRKKDGAVFILDTKWKLLNNDRNRNYGISQADLYQMYAYQKKYESKNVTLIYPVPAEKTENEIMYLSRDEAEIHVKFFDFFDIKNSIENIAEVFV